MFLYYVYYELTLGISNRLTSVVLPVLNFNHKRVIGSACRVIKLKWLQTSKITVVLVL